MAESPGRHSLGDEIAAVSDRFESVLAELGVVEGRHVRDPGIAPWNIVVLLPFALADALGLPDGVASRMALANAFGAAHFLLHDRLLDGDEELTPAACHLGDASLLEFQKGYARLMSEDSPFWSHLRSYLSEFAHSLEWERRVLRSDAGARAVSAEALPETLRSLGRRMSPLKATAAAAALLSGRTEVLPELESMIDAFHSAYQLSDDLEDLTDDLAGGRWSVPAWIAADRGGLGAPSEWPDAAGMLASACGSGAFGEICDLMLTRYGTAEECARSVGSRTLVHYFAACADRSERAHSWWLRRRSVSMATCEPGTRADHASSGSPQPPHRFEMDGRHFVFDSGSGLLFEADRLAADALKWLRSGAPVSRLGVLRMNHGSAVDEALEEIRALGLGSNARAARPHVERESGPSLTSLACVALNVSGACNLRCDYCYLGASPRTGSAAMSDSTATAAIDLLFRESFGRRDLAVVFFGGEPLLEPGVVERAARYARAMAREHGRNLSLHMTTNGTLLTPDVAAMLSDLNVRILVSLDGGREQHDAHRKTADGLGSHDAVAANLRALPDGTAVSARATVTEESRPLPELVAYLKSLGCRVVHLAPVSGRPLGAAFVERLLGEFEELARNELSAALDGGSPSVGNFVEPILSLELGRRRLAPCGAGARYISVSHDGRLFLCHRFAGDDRFELGHVKLGLDRSRVGSLLGAFSHSVVPCESCWAGELCGGPCFHDVTCDSDDPAGSSSGRCRLIRRVFELSMWLYSSLPDECRDRLTRVAADVIRPEIDVERPEDGPGIGRSDGAAPETVGSGRSRSGAVSQGRG